jgi:hypothetical protein
MTRESASPTQLRFVAYSITAGNDWFSCKFALYRV